MELTELEMKRLKRKISDWEKKLSKVCVQISDKYWISESHYSIEKEMLRGLKEILKEEELKKNSVLL